MLFRVYCIAASLLYTAGMAASIILSAPAHGSDMLRLTALTSLFAAIHATAAFVPHKPWGWMFGLVVLCVDVPSWAMPMAVPLLFFWRRPLTKAAFGRL
jgi:hypothetical protein